MCCVYACGKNSDCPLKLGPEVRFNGNWEVKRSGEYGSKSK